MNNYYTYILASQRRGTLYIGVTSDLIRRIHEHKSGTANSFTKKYNVYILVYFESTPEVLVAISREKQLKAWRRSWKLQLIEKQNPAWRDLFPEICGS